MCCTAVMGATSMVLDASMHYEVHQGKISEEHIQRLYPLNQELLQEWPYLSAGTLEFYNEAWHSMLPSSVTLVLAYDADKIVGALIAFSADGPYGCAHVIDQHKNYRPGKSFYIALAMVIKPYQRRGIARKLLHFCEAAACEQGYPEMYLLTVVRSKEHPLKPDNAFDPNIVWERLGFSRIKLYEVYNWPTRCGVPGNEFAEPIDNTSQYWHKGISR